MRPRGSKLSPRGRFPSRKISSRRPSGGRIHRGSRSPIRMRSRSPNMRKTKHEPSKKHSHSPRPRAYPDSRLQSRVERVIPPPQAMMDRGARESKRKLSYDKRRISSRSPIPKSPPSRGQHVSHRRYSPSPPRHAQGRSISPAGGRHFLSPSKKRLRRPSVEMVREHRMPSTHISHTVSNSSMSGSYSRDEKNYVQQTSVRASYSAEQHRTGYDIPQFRESAVHSLDPTYMEQKRLYDERARRYNTLTLSERFQNVSTDVMYDKEKVHFTRQDLENITIDIKRDLRQYSPTIRRIFDPSNVKIMRRSNEGHRPLFDRDEIKVPSHDMREDAYKDHRLYAGASSSRSGQFVFNYKDMENYEVTRHRLESMPSTRPEMKLTDKWKRPDAQKVTLTELDRDERHRYVVASRSAMDFEDPRRMSRPKNVDQDFRPDERRSGRPEYTSSHKPLSGNPADFRRKDGPIRDARDHLREKRRSLDRDDLSSHSKRYHVSPKYSSSDRGRERSDSRSHRPESRGSPFKHRPRILLKSGIEKTSNIQWSEKRRSVSPKSSFYLHENRDRGSFHPRSSVRGFRGRGIRGRSFRGGSFRGTRGFRGGRSSFRGSFRPPRRGGSSPSRWKHDMFAKDGSPGYSSRD